MIAYRLWRPFFFLLQNAITSLLLPVHDRSIPGDVSPHLRGDLWILLPRPFNCSQIVSGGTLLFARGKTLIEKARGEE
jgi:hypothetical protein